MHARWLAVVLVGSACGQTTELSAPPPPPPKVEIKLPTPTATAPAAPLAPPTAETPAPAATGLPALVGPPPPLDRLRPQMKQADVHAALAEAGARKAGRYSPALDLPIDRDIYGVELPGVVAYLTYSSGRLSTITLRSEDPLALTTPVFARWGAGELASRIRALRTVRTWPASASGWTATLRTAPADNTYVGFTGAELALEATVTATAESSLTVTGKLFGQLGKLLGARLDAAETVLGPGLRRETADEDDAAPERGAARQGFAQMKTPWSAYQWQLVLRTATGSEQIESAELTGSTDDEAQRVALFAALRAAFGAPQPVVSPAGRIEIQLTDGSVVATVVEGENESGWTITLRRR